MPHPAITVVICTHNRAPQLERCLREFRKVHHLHLCELVIVDNGSTDQTAAVVLHAAESFETSVRLIHEPVAGLGRARNTGIAAARGDIVAFTDDDCYPEADWLSQLLTCFSDHELSFVGGRVLLFDPDDAPICILESDRIDAIPRYTFVEAGRIAGANMAFRRTALDRVSGFDSDLGAGTPFPCEDIDIIARMSFAGLLGLYHPGPTVMHHHGRRTARDIEKLERSYDAGRGAYFAKALLLGDMRRPYARRLLTKVRNQPLRLTLSEMQAALRYLIFRARRSVLG